MGKYGKRDDMIVYQAEPYNAEPTPAALDGLPVTPLNLFYGRNHGPMPQVDPDTWQLEVGGLVQRPLTLTLTDLRRRFRRHSVVATLICAGNRRGELMPARPIPEQIGWGPGAISTAEWSGARLGDVLAAAGLTSGTEYVEFIARDVSQQADPPQAFGASIPVAKATAGEVLLAWEMNGMPLPAAHGGRCASWCRATSAPAATGRPRSGGWALGLAVVAHHRGPTSRSDRDRRPGLGHQRHGSARTG